MNSPTLDLLTLQTRIKAGIEQAITGRLWVRSEIAALKVSRGHCYMELSQSENGILVAKASAIIWASSYRSIASRFKAVTGSDLQEGMDVRLEVCVNYSELYGLSLIVCDIDVEYVLGEKELERQRCIERLKKEGLMDLQKQLGVPLLPYRLAVVSGTTAAGYRDFMRHLNENEYGFRFYAELFPALMQGKDAPASIVEAMGRVLAAGQPFDLILILRGGGAKLDLACYDDYVLAAAIARSPVPVFTAVGHDQDFHVCDMVAHTYLKTPTALADEIIGYYEAEDERISSCGTRIRTAFLARLTKEEERLSGSERFIRNMLLSRISAGSAQLDFIEMKIGATDPRAILSKGYTLVTDAGHRKLQSAGGVNVGDRIGVMFSDATLECTVERILKNTK